MADLGRRGKVLRGGGGDTTSGAGRRNRTHTPAPSDEQLDTSLDAQGPVRPP